MPLYTSYLSHLLPAALSLLAPDSPAPSIPISFTRDAVDQKLRHCLLTFIQKLPHTDPFRQYEKDVMDLMIRLLALENEENALVCVKVVIDGFRSHRVRCKDAEMALTTRNKPRPMSSPSWTWLRRCTQTQSRSSRRNLEFRINLCLHQRRLSLKVNSHLSCTRCTHPKS